MSSYQVHVFVSHSWAYSDHYEKIDEWLFDQVHRFGQASVRYHDYSVPKNDPIHHAPNERALQDAIFAKISRSHVVVIPTGMYANYSKWIRKEIDGARHWNKGILAVNPWGQQRKSSVVASAANTVVGWNRQSVVRGVWDLYYR